MEGKDPKTVHNEDILIFILSTVSQSFWFLSLRHLSILNMSLQLLPNVHQQGTSPRVPAWTIEGWICSQQEVRHFTFTTALACQWHAFISHQECASKQNKARILHLKISCVNSNAFFNCHFQFPNVNWLGSENVIDSFFLNIALRIWLISPYYIVRSGLPCPTASSRIFALK